ncbi:MAG: cyclopropane fatty acyl phospholipid synthase [Thiohalocapsa sp.]|nr:cyclopropane fatty acyl phospholipid synthase [Thiohalocapsa sp.]
MSVPHDANPSIVAARPRGIRIAPPRGGEQRALLQALVEPADIRFDGSRPQDMQISDPACFERMLRHGSLGLGESYMDGQWDARRLDETLTRLLAADVESRLTGPVRLQLALAVAKTRLWNRQTRGRAFEVGERHYDIGNDVYRTMLDPTMSYSCGYWAEADSLDAAQSAKLELICRKLDLRPGEHVLDIGCGWGGLAEYAARTRGVRVLGVTVSKEQAALARERCAGLPVEIRLADYRSLQGRFDKVVSVGMFEHVGRKNHAGYFRRIAELLSDDGLFLLQTIGTRTAEPVNDPWIDAYIFPNGELPNTETLARATRRDFVLEDWHGFGADYDRTLMAWWRNFERGWPALEAAGYDRRFYRMWKYYLHCCAGFFRSRKGQLWQLVLSKPSRPGSYRSLR